MHWWLILFLDYSQSILKTIDENILAQVQQTFDEMTMQAINDMRSEDIDEADMEFVQYLDVRYQGQAFELTIPFTDNVLATFHEAYDHSYGYAMPQRPVEIVNVRLQAIGLVQKPQLEPESLIINNGQSALIGAKNVILEEGMQSIKTYDRGKFLCGATIKGSALVFQLDSTTFIPSNWVAQVDEYHNLLLEFIEETS